jgi:hypothetical protein
LLAFDWQRWGSRGSLSGQAGSIRQVQFQAAE